MNMKKYECPFCEILVDQFKITNHLLENHKSDVMMKYIDIMEIIESCGSDINTFTDNNTNKFYYLDLLIRNKVHLDIEINWNPAYYPRSMIINGLYSLLSRDTVKLSQEINNIKTFANMKGYDPSNMFYPLIRSLLN